MSEIENRQAEVEAARDAGNCDLCHGTGECDYLCRECQGRGVRKDENGNWQAGCPATYRGKCRH